MKISLLEFLVSIAILSCAVAATAAPPAVTDGTPAAGKRVRVTAPEYASTNVYHTLYLPTNWQPDGQYPVIVEFAPNRCCGFAGTVEDTHLGYYQSGGTDAIWVTMPFIDYRATPDRNATTWYGGGAVDTTGQQLTADYTQTNLIQIMEDYGGDTSSVFVTGFSRGAIATGHVGLATDEMADIWLGFLPHSHHDSAGFTPDPGDVRISRVNGRASFITYGQNDGGSGNSITGLNKLTSLGFPVESYALAGLGHTDEWITDASTPIASSDSNVANVTDVRARLRNWMDDVIANKPGTHSISGVVTDLSGSPVAGARVQSGKTHWTFTDVNGAYELAGLVDSTRAVTVSHEGLEFLEKNVVVSNANLTAQNFMAVTSPPPPPPPPPLTSSLFSDDFNDTTVGPWVNNGGAWSHTGTVLNLASTAGINGATVEVPSLGGANTTDFVMSVEIDPVANTQASGFGFLSTNSNLAAGGNSYYLVDIANSQLRIAEINVNSATSVRIGDTGLQQTPFTFSNDEVYTLSVEGTYGEDGLTLFVKLTSVGGDNDDVSLAVTDATVLTGQHFGLETWAGGTRNFDNFSISLSGSPSVTGDINQDGVVNRADIALFTGHFGIASGSTFTTGDFNADGRTSLADLALLQANLGNTSLSPVAVPEPSIILLLLLALAIVSLRSRRAIRLQNGLNSSGQKIETNE